MIKPRKSSKFPERTRKIAQISIGSRLRCGNSEYEIFYFCLKYPDSRKDIGQVVASRTVMDQAKNLAGVSGAAYTVVSEIFDQKEVALIPTLHISGLNLTTVSIYRAIKVSSVELEVRYIVLRAVIQ